MKIVDVFLTDFPRLWKQEGGWRAGKESCKFGKP